MTADLEREVEYVVWQHATEGQWTHYRLGAQPEEVVDLARTVVPGGWLYVVNGHPVYVPDESAADWGKLVQAEQEETAARTAASVARTYALRERAAQDHEEARLARALAEEAKGLLQVIEAERGGVAVVDESVGGLSTTAPSVVPAAAGVRARHTVISFSFVVAASFAFFLALIHTFICLAGGM